MANSILSADRKGHMQDSKALIKTSLDEITILGHSHNEINKRKRETISSGLNKESRQSSTKTIDNSHKLFGGDLSKTLKEMKEVKKVAKEIPIKGHPMHKREATLTRETMIKQQAIGETNINNRQEVEEVIVFGGAGKQIEGENPAIDGWGKESSKIICKYLPNIIEVLNFQMMSNKAGSLKSYLQKWQEFTSDPEILDTVSGMTIEFDDAHKALQPRANHC